MLALFKVGWAGERMTFDQLSAEFERSHFAGLSENTVKGHRAYLRHLKAFFAESRLSRITVEMVEEYRSQRRAQLALPRFSGALRRVLATSVFNAALIVEGELGLLSRVFLHTSRHSDWCVF